MSQSIPRDTVLCPSIQAAFPAVQQVVQLCRNQGVNPLQADVGVHVNPGDVYDAYEEIGYTACQQNTLRNGECGPLIAYILQQRGVDAAADWETILNETFDPNYVEGFTNGFALMLPVVGGAGEDTNANGAGVNAGGVIATLSDADVRYVRGLYDGVMAHAAVF